MDSLPEISLNGRKMNIGRYVWGMKRSSFRPRIVEFVENISFHTQMITRDYVVTVAMIGIGVRNVIVVVIVIIMVLPAWLWRLYYSFYFIHF
jgi:hypothetical protein